jgi:methyl-galactoside transport system permease protein
MFGAITNKVKGVKNIRSKEVIKWMVDNAILLVLLFLLLTIIVISPDFVSLNNLRNIFSQASTRIIIALGIGGLIITQGTDLSAGRMVGLAAVVSASLLQDSEYAYRMYPNLPHLYFWGPILFVAVITGILGLINGFIISILKVTPFIATLGTMIIVYGINSTYFDRPPYGAQPIGGLDEEFMRFAQGYFNLGGFKLPYIVIYAAIVTFFIWLIWNKTKFGKNIFAVGGNPEAAVVSGVNLTMTLMLVYMMAGILYGFAGALEAARVGTATNNTGNMYELDAIAACVVGGVSFTGGVGTVRGVVIGVLIFQVINYGLAFIGVNPYLQYIIKGLIIIMAVAIDTRKYIKKK